MLYRVRPIQELDVRSLFGQMVSEYRARSGMSLRSFAREVGVSPSQMSNIENGREPISERILEAYTNSLQLNEEEIEELRRVARASNERRSELRMGTDPQVADLVAILRMFGSDLSGEATEKFRAELERDLGLSATALFLKIGNRQSGRANRESKARQKMLPLRLASLAWLGLVVRRSRFGDYEKAVTDVLLDKIASSDPLFNYEIVSKMPDAQADAFAYLRLEGDGFTLYLRENIFQRSAHEPYYRYVIAHELAHYLLHRRLFSKGDSTAALPAARMSNKQVSSGWKKEVIESLPEVDADALAVFILVPWERFLTGLSVEELATDYNVDQTKVMEIERLFRQRPVYEELARVLHELGEHDHPIFKKLMN